MNQLPKWVLANPFPAIHDFESLTVIDQTARLYGAMQSLIDEYNAFAEEANKQLASFTDDEAEARKEFELQITKVMNEYTCSMNQYLKINLDDTATKVIISGMNDGTIPVPTDTGLKKSNFPADAAATGAAIAVERARITNLSALPEGSTQGDAELQDIRIGFDGNAYPSAGEAVRAQAKNADDLYADLAITWISGAYISGRYGSKIEYAEYSYTDYIDISAYRGCSVLVKCRHRADAGYAFYDGSLAYVSGDCPSKHSDTAMDAVKYEKITVPENACFIRISAKGDADLNICGVSVSQATKETFEKLFPILPASWISGAYISGRYGSEIEYAEYSYTDYIDISAYRGCSVLVKYRHYSDVGYAFYGEGKEYIAGDCPTVSGDVSSNKIRIVKITVPENAYFIRFSARTETDNDMCYVRPSPDTAELCERYNKKDKEFLKYLQQNVICIGDSLTHGAYYGEGYDGAGIKENYPYFLSKMTGWNVTEAGDSGYAPKGWYVYSLPQYNFADYDTALIWLGTNKGLTDTLAEDTASGERNTYADTETAYYCKIIERIVEQNPSIRIFLGTVFRVTGSTRAITNSVINQIAAKYPGNVVGVVDNNKGNLFGGDRQDILHPFGNSTHFGKIGNAYVAKNWLDGITEIIEKNPTAFEIPLI